ncbi:hypothetical protein B0H63DRAFT_223139 [Podospora didyma]|uniref:Secreted protein n=1 Tax=Podospora didyma TaxID=330526 RepID=A0AAE0KKH3_9PEZI|nr:hypothetical protein B0H63DRAFT_223139 [Podospora didyma]
MAGRTRCVSRIFGLCVLVGSRGLGWLSGAHTTGARRCRDLEAVCHEGGCVSSPGSGREVKPSQRDLGSSVLSQRQPGDVVGFMRAAKCRGI